MLDHRILECYANYIHQIFLQKSADSHVKGRDLSPSQRLHQAWQDHPTLAKMVLDYFKGKFLPTALPEGEEKLQALHQEIQNFPEKDRADFQPMLEAIDHTVRTNFYHPQAQALVIKILHRDGVREIFMDHPTFQGVLLKGAMMARGGLRWSDRGDFRTECWQLMQTQVLKNSIIVPSGAKGAFLLKNTGKASTETSPLQAYELFVEGLLDISDNLKDGQVVSPPQVRAYDGPDFYNVVAADKGTASFSDHANALALRREYWLGDAFASGGSNGYNHKKLAITSRGAWISVRHHLEEMGHDFKKPLRLVGVGDMAGDIFGNGLLEESNLQLLAAFNHEAIFIDPNPNPDASYRERCRLFHLPQSKWRDYADFSPGGAVYDRSQETIELSPEACSLLGLRDSKITPHGLIREILKMPVDLLWLGGIGTFVQGEEEMGVLDAANAPIRIFGKNLRAKIVGEGANLGMTQGGRIEYALHGGRLNTDAIDNCAGVNCSDHEINIKILLDEVLRRGEISHEERRTLLQDLTKDVCALVLRENTWQNLTLTALSRRDGSKIMGDSLQCMAYLMGQGEEGEEVGQGEEMPQVGQGGRDKPRDETLDALYKGLMARKNQEGSFVTRPEMAVLLAYGKKHLKAVFSRMDLSSWGQVEASQYFPRMIQERFSGFLKDHFLFDAIKKTVLTNRFIDLLGPLSLMLWAQDFSLPFPEVLKALLQWDEEIQGYRWSQKIEGLGDDIQGALELMELYKSIIRAGLTQWAKDRQKNPGQLLSIKAASIPLDLWEKYEEAMAVVTTTPSHH